MRILYVKLILIIWSRMSYVIILESICLTSYMHQITMRNLNTILIEKFKLHLFLNKTKLDEASRGSN